LTSPDCRPDCGRGGAGRLSGWLTSSILPQRSLVPPSKVPIPPSKVAPSLPHPGPIKTLFQGCLHEGRPTPSRGCETLGVATTPVHASCVLLHIVLIRSSTVAADSLPRTSRATVASSHSSASERNLNGGFRKARPSVRHEGDDRSMGRSPRGAIPPHEGGWGGVFDAPVPRTRRCRGFGLSPGHPAAEAPRMGDGRRRSRVNAI
jgi:hypothetical protein